MDIPNIDTQNISAHRSKQVVNKRNETTTERDEQRVSISRGFSLKVNEKLAVNRSLLACCACVRHRMRVTHEALRNWRGRLYSVKSLWGGEAGY
jgi:hypothetical protein